MLAVTNFYEYLTNCSELLKYAKSNDQKYDFYLQFECKNKLANLLVIVTC